MTQDEITEIYTEVSNKLCNGTQWCWAGVGEPLQLFAKLVAQKAKEQEYADLIRIIEANILEEREACAKVCEEAHELMNSSFQGAASAIRARGEA